MLPGIHFTAGGASAEGLPGSGCPPTAQVFPSHPSPGRQLSTDSLMKTEQTLLSPLPRPVRAGQARRRARMRPPRLSCASPGMPAVPMGCQPPDASPHGPTPCPELC